MTTAWLVWTPRPKTPAPAVARFDIVLPPGQLLPRGVAISPDGQTIAYSANRQLSVRTMSDSMVRPAIGTALTGYGPFFSPDGKWIGFYSPDDSSLKKIALTGGAPVTICKFDIPFGASWTRDGQILVASGGIFRVSATGGAPETLIAAKAGELMQGPQLLPDGDHVLFAVTTATGPDRWDRAQIVVHSLKSGERRVLVEGGSNPQLAIAGHLIYALGSTMLAVAFDAGRLAVTGSPIPLADQVAVAATGTSNIAIAGNGSIAHFIESESSLRATKLALVDRAGARTLLPVPEGRYSFPRVSPDGQQIAVVNQDQGKASIWIYDVSGTSSMRRLTFESATTLVWTRDGRRIAFGSNRESGTALYWQPADGSGSEERLTDLERADRYFPNDVTADGTLAFFSNRNNGDVWTIRLDGDRALKPLISFPSHEDHVSFSRDGRWMAYRSNESGRYEIYVQPYPPTGAKYQVTTTEAHSPLWSPDGKQIFYIEVNRGAGRLMSVNVRLQPGFAVSHPVALPVAAALDGMPRPYDILPDGKQFVVVVPASDTRPDQAATLTLRVALNAAADLKER